MKSKKEKYNKRIGYIYKHQRKGFWLIEDADWV